MGLYDRKYTQASYSDENPWSPRYVTGRPMYVIIIVVTVAVYLIDYATQFRMLLPHLELKGDTLTNPLQWYRYVTYGLVHSPAGIRHILFNMLGLFFLGRTVEEYLGRWEFLRFYVISIVIGGIVWSLLNRLLSNSIGVIGASGGVEAIVMLFILKNPRATLLFSFVVPMEAWLVGIIMIASNVFYFGGDTAVEVHLAGIGFAATYHYFHWSLGFLSMEGFRERIQEWRLSRRRRAFRVHRPEEPTTDEAEEADRILDKIHKQGEASLTSAERKTLESYSRKMRERRRSD